MSLKTAMLPEPRFGESSVSGWTGHTPSWKFPGKLLTDDPGAFKIKFLEVQHVFEDRDVTWSKVRESSVRGWTGHPLSGSFQESCLPVSLRIPLRSTFSISLISESSSGSMNLPQPLRLTASWPCLARTSLMSRMRPPVKVPIGEDPQKIR